MASRRDNLIASISRGRQLLNDRVDQLSERVDQQLTTVGQRIDGAAASYAPDPGQAPPQPGQHRYAVDGASNRGGAAGSDAEADLPPGYSRAHTGPAVPPGIVDHAAPGQTQAAVDQARAAARQPISPALDQNQQAPTTTTPNGRGQTVHSYYGAGGCAKVELFTPPQTVPTYMGGTRERGRGAFLGRVLFAPKAGGAERVSHISVKIKCVAMVRVPVMNQYAPYENPLMHRSPELERSQDKEQLLLQLEQVLYKAPPSQSKEDSVEIKQQLFYPAKAVANAAPGGAELLDSGSTASFRFSVDVPRDGNDGTELPPSFVLSADKDAQAPSPHDVRRFSTEPGLVGRGIGLLQSLREGVAPPPDKDQWANVKWYAKVTIGRPGRLQTNDRILIPFQYLPPPPPTLTNVLEKRVKTSEQLRQNTPFNQLVEPSSSWQDVKIGLAQAELQHRKRGLSALFSRGPQRVESDWSFEWPSSPPAFPVQASIPFTIVSKTQKQVGSPLAVALYRKINLAKRADVRAFDERIVCAARVASKPAILVSQAKGTATYRWQGVLDVPAHAGPSFATDVLGITYYLGVREAHKTPPPVTPSATRARFLAQPAPPPAEFVLIQPVEIYCPAPRMITQRITSATAPMGSPTTSVPGVPPPLPPPSRRPNVSATGSSAAEEKCAMARKEQEGLHGSAAPTSSAEPSTSSPATALPPTEPTTADDLVLNSPGIQEEELHTGLDLPPSYFEAVGIRDQET